MNKTGKDIVRRTPWVDRLATQLSLHDKTKEELGAIVERYPFFAFAQFLLYQKMKEERDTNAEKQMQKTALYFSNPFLFHYLTTANETNIIDSLDESLITVASVNEELQKENTATTTDTEKATQDIYEHQGEHILDLEEDGDVSDKEHEKLSRLIEQHLSEFKNR